MLTFKTNKNRFYDKVHRSVVSVLMGLTVVGAVVVGYGFYDWWYVYRPQVKEAHKQKLLAEGRSDFEEYTDDAVEPATLGGQGSSINATNYYM